MKQNTNPEIAQSDIQGADALNPTFDLGLVQTETDELEAALCEIAFLLKAGREGNFSDLGMTSEEVRSTRRAFARLRPVGPLRPLLEPLELAFEEQVAQTLAWHRKEAALLERGGLEPVSAILHNMNS